MEPIYNYKEDFQCLNDYFTKNQSICIYGDLGRNRNRIYINNYSTIENRIPFIYIHEILNHFTQPFMIVIIL